MGTNKNRLNRQLSFFPEVEEPYLIGQPSRNLSKAQRVHAEVTNSLQRALKGTGVAGYNRGLGCQTKPDLIISQKVVFEVKSKSRWADVYCCLGQLIIYSQGVGKGKPVLMVAVLPVKVHKRKVDALKRAGVIVVKWRKSMIGYEFLGLDALLAKLNQSGHIEAA